MARADFSKLVRSGEAQVGLAGAQHLARIAEIDLRALRLAVRPVFTAADVLVGNDPKVAEGAIKLLVGARDFA